MVSIIVFSKDRPLQLEGYLSSLMYYSGIPQRQITVLYTCSGEVQYDTLINKYEQITWIKESGYAADLEKCIRDSENYIMFGCDDVFFIESMNLNHALETLQKDESIFSFHLRLGLNIEASPEVEQHSNHIKWNWKQTKSMHWNYPWEVSAAIYRKKDVLSILNQVDFTLMKSPNYFEDLIFKGILAGDILIQSHLASFYKGKALTLTVNRVQEDYKNPFDQTDNTSVEDLYKAFCQNLYLDWRKFENSLNTYIHVNSQYFSLTDQDQSKFERPFPIMISNEQENDHKITQMGFGLKWLIIRNRFTRRLIRLINLINPSILLKIRQLRKKLRKLDS